MIHLLIHEARNLKMEKADTVDPIIEVSCFDKKKFTTCKDDIGYNSSVIWSEHIFFEPKNLSEREVQNGKLRIRMLDQQMLKNAVIGSYDFDLSYIYFKEKHAIFTQWIGISNPFSKDFTELSGYLKVSASVLGPGDEQIPLPEDTGFDRTEKQIVMVPPHISTNYYQLKFKIIKAEYLPQMDNFGTCDAFVRINYLGKTIQTSVVKQNNNQAYWAQELWIPVQTPLVSSRLILTVLDEDVTTNDAMGSLSFQIHEIIKRSKKGENFSWYWKDIYGSALDVTGKYTDEMNQIPEIASTWKGRILMQVTVEKSDKPEMKVRKVTDDVLNEAMKKWEKIKYEIMAEISQGICLPDMKLKVKLKIGEFELKTPSPKKYKNGFSFWNVRFGEKIWECPYPSVEAMPDVWIYIMNGDKPICFYRGKPEDFTDPNPDMVWVPLVNDRSVGEITESYKAGMISFRLSIHDQTRKGDVDWDYVPAWSNVIANEPTKYPIRWYVYQWRELPPSDQNWTSDPYVQIWSPFASTTEEAKLITTSIVSENNNPIFYNTIQSYFYWVELDWAPPIVLEIYDKDYGAFDSDDFIGRAVISLRDASVSYDESIPKPKWHNVKLGFNKNEPAMGQILVSFSILNPKEAFKNTIYDIRLHPPCEDYEITINVLGLRDLQSPGILPVRKAFINFNLRSLYPPTKAHAVGNIETQPSSTGSNPTISTVIKFKISLPLEALYCPSLTWGVYDYIFKGLSQPLIGNFVIPVGELQHLQDEMFQEEDSKTQEIIKELEVILEDVEKVKEKLRIQKEKEEAARKAEELLKKKIKGILWIYNLFLIYMYYILIK